MSVDPSGVLVSRWPDTRRTAGAEVARLTWPRLLRAASGGGKCYTASVCFGLDPLLGPSWLHKFLQKPGRCGDVPLDWSSQVDLVGWWRLNCCFLETIAYAAGFKENLTPGTWHQFYAVSLARGRWALDLQRQDANCRLAERMLSCSGGHGSDWVRQSLRVTAQEQSSVEQKSFVESKLAWGMVMQTCVGVLLWDSGTLEVDAVRESEVSPCDVPGPTPFCVCTTDCVKSRRAGPVNW
jgi:hypothetical protein